MKPKQFFFALLAAIGILIIASGGGYYLALGQLHAQSAQLSSQLAEQTAAEADINNLTKLKHQYDKDLVPILPLIDGALPREKNQTEILAQLQRIASDVGLVISSVSMPSPTGLPTGVSQTIKAGEVLALPISFQLSGSYAQLQTFTQRVENLNRYTNITNLAISRPDKSKPIVYSVSLNAYIKP